MMIGIMISNLIGISNLPQLWYRRNGKSRPSLGDFGYRMIIISAQTY